MATIGLVLPDVSPCTKLLNIPWTYRFKLEDFVENNNGEPHGRVTEDDFGGIECPSVSGFHSPLKVRAK